MSTSLKDKTIVVTGASAGVGRAIVREFAKQGARLTLVARGEEGLVATQKEVLELGGQAIIFPADVSDPLQVEKAADAAENAFGPIDIWINDAMLSVFSPVKEMLPEEYKRVTEVTYLGYVYGTLAALNRMLPRNEGLILQVSSALGYRSIPLQSAYCAAKRAVVGFSESLRCELLHDKSQVRVTLLELPAVNTPQFSWVKSRLPRKPQPVPPIFQPEVIARAAVFAATHKRREIKIGFSTLLAIFAEKISPAIADRYLAHTGYKSQQTHEAVEPNRRDNLWAPLPGDRGAHGDFDQRSHKRSIQLALTENRGLVFCVLVLGIGAWIANGRR